MDRHALEGSTLQRCILRSFLPPWTAIQAEIRNKSRDNGNEVARDRRDGVQSKGLGWTREGSAEKIGDLQHSSIENLKSKLRRHNDRLRMTIIQVTTAQCNPIVRFNYKKECRSSVHHLRTPALQHCTGRLPNEKPVNNRMPFHSEESQELLFPTTQGKGHGLRYWN